MSAVAKYRKKPVVIEAIQYTGDNADEVLAFGALSIYKSGSDGPISYLHISTLEGTLDITISDWIIKGVKGEFYPCKPDIFVMTYEVVQ